MNSVELNAARRMGAGLPTKPMAGPVQAANNNEPAPRLTVPAGLTGGLKRTLDLALTIPALVFAAPLLGAIALMIKREDGGPAIYRHTRVGRNGEKFDCLKFRTMVVNGDEVLKAHLEINAAARAEWAAKSKLRDDPRVTRIGKFLRAFSLDELPQLWNVVRGEMSLVGPRPVSTRELDFYGEDLPYLLAATPGLTGLWQVSGRSDTTYAERVALDKRYVAEWRLWRDVAIIGKTFGVILFRKGAY